jgi:hypothetical protein
MEPRPQRPRSVSGQPPRPSNGEQTDHGTGTYAGPPGSAPYQEPFDPTTFIAPPRTEYDYSPLDLAPPGERRKRQFVAAAVGGLLVVLLAAVAVFAYLMLKPDNKDGGTNDLAAAQTQVARNQATLSAQQTVIAQAADKETATVGAPGAATAPARGAAATPDGTKTAGQSATRPPVATGSGSGASSSAKGPSPKTLKTYLPDDSAMPQGLTTVTDADRSFDDVVKALGGTSSVESNLKKWGWSGNVERKFDAPDPSQLVAGATTTITVSVHGFASASGAKNALKLYADVLAAVPGYQEMQAPKIGDNARLLQSTDAEGTTNVALYVQKGNVLYRFGGSSTGGDPTSNVQNVAEATLAIKQS